MQVNLAFDPLIEREIAIKVLSQDVAASKVALQRFLQEARSIGRLNHPNVVSITEPTEAAWRRAKWCRMAT